MQAPPFSLAGRASAALGLVALGLAVASLWPSGGIPPWPAASTACLALALAWVPSTALPRALGTLAGVLALTLSSTEIAALWALSEVLPT